MMLNPISVRHATSPFSPMTLNTKRLLNAAPVCIEMRMGGYSQQGTGAFAGGPRNIFVTHFSRNYMCDLAV